MSTPDMALMLCTRAGRPYLAKALRVEVRCTNCRVALARVVDVLEEAWLLIRNAQEKSDPIPPELLDQWEQLSDRDRGTARAAHRFRPDGPHSRASRQGNWDAYRIPTPDPDVAYPATCKCTGSHHLMGDWLLGLMADTRPGHRTSITV